jgi:2-hydroxy-3-oxopropionate reductase
MADAICVIGLGLMGRPIARRLIAHGWAVRGWNRSLLSEELAGDIPRATALSEAAQSDICLLMLADAPAVAAVLAQLEPHLRAGQLVLDMSSASPTDSREHARRLAERGIGWVDAPVSGGPEGAQAGTLAIMAGGEPADFARARRVLDVLGGSVVLVGAPGMGHTVKLINQVITALMIEAVAEGLTLAEKSGVDPRLVQQALRSGFADSLVLRIHGERMITRSYRPGGFVRQHLKDLRMAEELAKSAGVQLPHFMSVMGRFVELVARGEGELDHSALHKLLWTE